MRDKYFPAKPADVKKVIELKWGKEGATHQLRGSWPQWYASLKEVDGGWQWSSQTEDGTPCATLDEAKAAAEASLGVRPVPLLLRWKVDGMNGGAELWLGNLQVADVWQSHCGDVWPWESYGRSGAISSTRAEAMCAVEAAFGIGAPLPVEGE